MPNCLVWIFGRGASAACNLHWTVPKEWQAYDRNLQISKIKEAILSEMNSPHIDTGPYKLLLSELAKRTNPNWHHCFLTTNWDFLLQREIKGFGLTSAPRWLPETHVYHINGTVEKWPSAEKAQPPLRSPFLLESDLPKQRLYSSEVQQAVQYIIWRRAFIIIGMSFECLMDRAFLRALGNVEDELPIGNALWIVINHDNEALQKIYARLHSSFPKSKYCLLSIGFKEWIQRGMLELVDVGILKDVQKDE
jgi:hypothetical protein